MSGSGERYKLCKHYSGRIEGHGNFCGLRLRNNVIEILDIFGTELDDIEKIQTAEMLLKYSFMGCSTQNDQDVPIGELGNGMFRPGRRSCQFNNGVIERGIPIKPQAVEE